MNDLTLRVLSGMPEFLAAESLQRAVWGPGDKEDPADLMMVIQHEGGLAAGAFLGHDLAGYVFGFPTRDPEVQHSHRLAVHPRARGKGLAARLKFFQRDWCLARGITRVRWTFDPLRHTNAHLNIGRLGARVSRYFTDYYGEMKGINAGLPSDRMLAEWHLNAGHVKRLSEAGDGAAGTERDAGDAKFVSIDRNVEQLIDTDLGRALAERLRVRRELTSLLDAGYEIRGYDAQACSYILLPARSTELRSRPAGFGS